MDDVILLERLGALEPSAVDPVRERAIKAVPARIRATRSKQLRLSRRPWPRFATACVVVLATLVAFSLVTAPGQALTTWAGDQLGLGEPGRHPTLQSLRHFAMQGTGGERQPAYVLVRGPGPIDGHYELITYRVKPEPGKEFPANGARCFQLAFPEARSLFHIGCGLPPADDGLLFGGVGGNAGPGTRFQFACGRVSAGIASVELEVDGRPIPVELRSIPGELTERFQMRRPFKFFIAFIDGDLRTGTVTVTARDSSGRPVARRTSTTLGTTLMHPST